MRLDEYNVYYAKLGGGGGIMDNKFDFMSEVADAFAGLKSNEEIEDRANEMIKLILQQKELSKGYLKVGIL